LLYTKVIKFFWNYYGIESLNKLNINLTRQGDSSMTIQPGANVYTQGFGSRPENVEVPHIDLRAPAVTDVLYPIGKRWINTVASTEYSLTSFSSALGVVTANWSLLGTDTGALNTLTGNTGGAIAPAAGNISIVGTGGLTFAGSGSTLTGSISAGTAFVTTITGGSGGALSPTAGNINILGTANQITSTGSGSTVTLSLPSAITAPGSLTTTTSLTAGSGLTVTTGGATVTAGGAAITGTTTINTTGAATTTIGTGGTGAVAIGNATGNTAVTGSLTASTGLVATTGGVTATAGGAAITGTTTINTTGAAVTTIGTGGTGAVNIGNATGNTAVTGSLTASTSLTATLGAITATNGNLVLGTAGNKILSTSVATTTTAGANSFGSVTLASGTATVATTAVTANSLIVIWRQGVGASTALGELTVGTITASTSFVINAATQGTPGTPLATDASVVGWMIIN
jgi:hypothetical protein